MLFIGCVFMGKLFNFVGFVFSLSFENRKNSNMNIYFYKGFGVVNRCDLFIGSVRIFIEYFLCFRYWIGS